MLKIGTGDQPLRPCRRRRNRAIDLEIQRTRADSCISRGKEGESERQFVDVFFTYGIVGILRDKGFHRPATRCCTLSLSPSENSQWATLL